jgi:vitamin B12 transporter
MMKHLFVRRISALLLVLSTFLTLPVLGLAQEETQPAPTETLDDIMVTATRTESSTGKIGGISATVINAEDIEAKQQHTVEEILKGVPGLDISANGGPGTQSSVFIRGADAKNTLVLVDGIMFNDPSSANRSADLGNLTADNIERIEVIRGPSSVLYGSNATAGVINIITKKGRGKPSIYAGGEGGSYNTWKAYGGASGAVNRFNFSLSASHIATHGFSIADADNDRIPHAGNTSEDDGWKNTTLSGKFGFDITPDFDINAVLRYLDSETDTDNSGPGYAGDRFDSAGPPTWATVPNPTGSKEERVENDQFFGKVNIHNYFFKRFFESNFSFQASDQDSQSYDNDGNKSYDYDGETREFSWQGSLNFSEINLLTFGTSYFEEEMESQSSGITSKDSGITSVWLQDQIFVGHSLDIVAGLRYDDHDKFGDKTTYRIAPAYTIDQTGTLLKASYGTGFRAPSLYELYSSYGSQTLKPEESEGWDIGFEQGFADNKIKLGLTYFDMIFTDRIGFDMATYTYNQLPGDTKSNGVEAFVQWAPVSDLDFLVNYTYNDTEDPNGEQLVRRPENKVHFNTRYRFLERAMVNLDLFWVGDRDAYSGAMDLNGNSVDVLDSYFLVNVSGSYDISDNIQLYGRVDNLFDETYEEAWSYASAGLSAYIGVKFTY